MATPEVSSTYVTIRVINTAGQPITNANLTIKMLRTEFQSC